jgi:hypothetical protein
MKKFVLSIILFLIALYLLSVYYPIQTSIIWAFCSLFVITFIAICGRSSKETTETLKYLDDSLKNEEKDRGEFKQP